LWELPIGVEVGGLAMRYSVRAWINNGLMAIFFDGRAANRSEREGRHPVQCAGSGNEGFSAAEPANTYTVPAIANPICRFRKEQG